MNSQPRSKNRNRASIGDVAKRAGVSIATVSRVINQTAPVAPHTVSQVRRAITELNYRPRAAAQVLASRKTNTIGLLISDIAGDFFSPMLRGIEAGAREYGFNLLIYSTGGGYSPAAATPSPLGEHNTDGMLVFVDSIPKEELTHLVQIEFPLVLIHHSPPAGLHIPCVTIENKLGAQKIVDHLIVAHGYRRIAFLTGLEEQEDSYWREMGYRESLALHKIPFDPALISVGGFNRERAYSAVESLLNDKVEFDAIFCCDDESAMGAMAALNQLGKRIPEDVAVVGFDDTYLSQYLNPALTTVHAPIEAVGRKAMTQLVQLIRGQRADPLVLLPTELVIRRSCGCGQKN